MKAKSLVSLSMSLLVLWFLATSNVQESVVNDDGSVDFYLAPKPVKGYEANTVITNPATKTTF
jgi:hypothetical protein